MRCLQHESDRRLTKMMAQQSEEMLKAGDAVAAKKELAQFDSPALEHLRECNLAAYEKMLTDMMSKIDDVLERS